MDRNRSETALRCLEVALHPNTDDKEVVAAIRGFRRTAAGASLQQIFASLTGDMISTTRRDQSPVWRRIIERLSRENHELRHQLEIRTTRETALASRLDQAERRALALGEQLVAAQKQAPEAARQRAELKAAFDAVCRERDALRAAIEQAKRRAPHTQQSAVPFHKLLAAARSQSADELVAGGSSSALSGLPSVTNRAVSARNPSRPWQA